MKYSIINAIYNLPFSNYLGGFIKKKLIKNNKITFIPTNKIFLPKKNHPIQNSIEFQKKIIETYKTTSKLSFNTFLELKSLLKEKFDPNTKFNFLDFGGDKLDFYLDITKEFKNINYYLINLPEVNEIINEIKNTYNYDNLKILSDLNEVKKNHYDFVYFGSTLQYLDNHELYIEELLPITKTNILFSATWFFSNDSLLKKIIVKQLNYLPKEFYLYFINLNSFIEIFKKHNFQVEFNKENGTHPCSFENFKKLKIDNIKYTNILFTKN
tara:strand:+ start:510 stop:1316 length:807 start_codon:yes stop_codon:yes gene_type:complete